MGVRPPVPLKLGDVLELKKPHACGANRWEVIRLGQDIRLRCQGCDRLVMLPRSRLERRIRKIEGPVDSAPSES
ncbi:MAG: DUF951 domain-containing protein [Armatimonadetes bacterium]|nr:DUF951 domain-containing protein [Armatimonadota bacterium]